MMFVMEEVNMGLNVGLCEYSNGDKYEGQWQDDKRSGHGMNTLKS